MLFAAGADAALLFQGVSVVDDNLVGLRVHDVELPILGVNGDPDGIDQAFLDLIDDLVASCRISGRDASCHR